jgi:hypothetical protein
MGTGGRAGMSLRRLSVCGGGGGGGAPGGGGGGEGGGGGGVGGGGGRGGGGGGGGGEGGGGGGRAGEAHRLNLGLQEGPAAPRRCADQRGGNVSVYRATSALVGANGQQRASAVPASRA